jgi:hypothetical protein
VDVGRQPLHARLYDHDPQLGDMTEAGIALSSLACLLESNASTDELINNDLAKVQAAYPGRFIGLPQAPILEGTRVPLNGQGRGVLDP